MNIIQISNLFNTLAAMHTGLASYHFGWPSDRIRNVANNYDEAQQLGATFPRVMWLPPDDGSLDIVRLDNEIPCTLIFDDLFGYDDQGNIDVATSAEKWSNLKLAALQYMRLLKEAARATMPMSWGIVDNRVRWTLDATSGNQRLISVVLRFTLFTKADCNDLPLAFPDDVPAGYSWPPSTSDDLEKVVP